MRHCSEFGNILPIPYLAGTMADEKHAGGRPTKYDPGMDGQAEKLCKLGATDKELAEFFEIAESTLNEWKLTYTKFSESIRAGKMLADANVAERLYQRAMGFEHDSEEIKVVEGVIERVPIRKIYPPDSTAAIFWLKNRQKDKWRDKTETEFSGGLDLKQITGVEVK
jgi:hypothetical protein